MQDGAWDWHVLQKRRSRMLAIARPELKVSVGNAVREPRPVGHPLVVPSGHSSRTDSSQAVVEPLVYYSSEIPLPNCNLRRNSPTATFEADVENPFAECHIAIALGGGCQDHLMQRRNRKDEGFQTRAIGPL